MTPITEDEYWRALAEQASKETNDEKLLILVRRLCDAFDQSQQAATDMQRKRAVNDLSDENKFL
jgi:hypothetical protein